MAIFLWQSAMVLNLFSLILFSDGYHYMKDIEK